MLFTYTEEELREMNEAQLQAVIRSYTKKFASSSDRKASTNKGTTTVTTDAGSYKSHPGSTLEDDSSNSANIKNLNDQIELLKKENRQLKEATSQDYRALYEKYYHEATLLKNQVFELKRKLNTD
jgi:septal ring factor EnvC (AmiA/AmiB activator)